MDVVGERVAKKGYMAVARWWPVVATFALYAFLWRTQRQLTVQGGAGWDGYYYLQMAMGLPAPRPYCLRIGYPLLVRFCSGPLSFLATFAVLAKVFGVAYGCASAYVLRRVVPHCCSYAYCIAWGLLNLSEMSPLRQAFWYPTNTDIPANLSFLALTWATLSLRRGWRRDAVLSCCTLLGTLVRENFSFNVLLVCAVDFLYFERGAVVVRATKDRLATALCCAAAVLASFSVVGCVQGAWPLGHKGEDVLTNLLSHQFAALLGSFLCVYGFAALVALAKGGEALAARPPWSASALLFVLTTVPVAIVGGKDTERFLFWYQLLLVVLLLPKLDALCRGGRWFELGVVTAFFGFTHRTFFAINVQGRLSGCSLHDFIGKTSPALIGYSRMCAASTASMLLPVTALAFVLLISRRVRVRWNAA